jgi:DNA-binding NtrC family response regulator
MTRTATTAEVDIAPQPSRERQHGTAPSNGFVAESAAARRVLEEVEWLARLESSVLVTGERGAGKSTLARLVHQWGPRAAEPFVAVSCAALPRDVLDAELFGRSASMAGGGTLFLDDVEGLPLGLQERLLALLEDRNAPANARLIAATSEDLKALCARGRFREDLLFRLDVLRLHAPRLAERPEDILALAERALARAARPCRLTGAARRKLLAYPWPGNVRELEDALERAAALSADGMIDADDIDLDADHAAPTHAGRTMADIEKTIYNKLRRLRS